MMDIEGLQALLFKWLKHFGGRSREQIRSACRGLLKSYKYSDENTDKYCLYYLLDPLLRRGVVEFTGKGNYQISPPVILYYKEDNEAVAVNLNNQQIENLRQIVRCFHVDRFNIVRCKSSMSVITDYARQTGIMMQQGRISSVLSRIPSILDMVRAFKVFYPNSTKGFQFWNLTYRCWERIKENQLRPGLYKASGEDFSNRYFYGSDFSWRKIPGLEENPDAVNVVKCAQAILEGGKILRYCWKSKRLTMHGIKPPIILDRILRIPSLPGENGVKRLNGSMIYKNISIIDYKKLSRIFCKIEELTK
jgi:hypothetical protein